MVTVMVMIVVIVPAVVPAPARAELLEVRQVAGGMECPECARGLRLLVKGIAGVDDADTSWNRRILTVRLHAGNGATLAQIRSAVSRQHFQAREAEIVVGGRLIADAAGQPWLSVPETKLSYRIDQTGRDARWRRALADLRETEIVMTGRVPGALGGRDPLVLFPLEFHRARPGR
jgi:hypothetical protein